MMMLKNKLSKAHLPLIFLLLISGFWSYYYLSSNALNDYGSYKPEWLLMIDGFLVLPVLCFLCIKDKKEAAIKALVYSSLIVLLGSWVIPQHSKMLWSYFESGRYLLLAIFLVVELVAITTVILAIKARFNQNVDPDFALSHPIEKYLGKTITSKLICFEVRVWSYLLFANRIKSNQFIGGQHFSYHNKDDTKTNLLGFILVIAFELPITHLLIHFIWSPIAANVISALTLLSLVFFIAEYRAVSRRPISITPTSVLIRFGIYNSCTVDFATIETVQANHQGVARASHIKRYNFFGHPNVCLKLKSGNLIYLGLDQPEQFIQVVKRQLEINQSTQP